MFKNVLVPTDGSKLSVKSIKRAIEIAKGLNAKVVGFHAYPEVTTLLTYEYVGPFNLGNKRDYDAKAKATAQTYVSAITTAAKTAGLASEGVVAASDQPYEAIIKAAKRKRCDLIIMASHGRGGVTSLLLGSVTQKVLNHSTIPVLVLR